MWLILLIVGRGKPHTTCPWETNSRNMVLRLPFRLPSIVGTGRVDVGRGGNLLICRLY